MKRVCVVALLGLILVWSSALNAQEQPPDAVFGVAVPLTGEFAPLGKQLKQAAELAARETGVAVVVEDTEGTTEGAAKAVTKLASDPRVLAIVGPVGRRTSEGAAPIANRLQVPMMLIGGTQAANRSSHWVFRLHLSPAEQGVEAARLARSLKHKKAAVFFPETAFGQEAAVAFTREFHSQGGTVKSVASYPTDETDFRKPLSVLIGKRLRMEPRQKLGKYKADSKGYANARRKPQRDFDVLFIPDHHSRVGRLLAFLPSAGLQNGESGNGVGVQLIGLSSWRGKSMELTGARAAGALILDTFGGEAVGGRSEEFSRSFENNFGRAPTSLETEVFDGVWMLASLAQQSMTPPTRRQLVLRLPRKKAWEGIAGELKFGPLGEPIRKQRLLRFDVDGVVIPMD